MSDQAKSTELRTFGRRKGRPPSPRQARLQAEVYPRVAIPTGVEPIVLTDDRETWLELGFGGGEHLVWHAHRTPQADLIGCEPFQDGVIKVLSAIAQDGLQNIRLYAGDGREVLRRLPESSITRVFVLYPDPWPKRRHAKRRLVTTSTLDLLARVMRPGAELRFATDIADYADTALRALVHHEAFDWSARGPADWRSRPEDWPQTRYEAKADRAGRRSYYFRFLRR